MNDKHLPSDQLLQILRERAKELNCLYQIEELLANDALSLQEVFEGIIKTIPSGWQYPEICQARIIYDNATYKTGGVTCSYFEQVQCNTNILS